MTVKWQLQAHYVCHSLHKNIAQNPTSHYPSSKNASGLGGRLMFIFPGQFSVIHFIVVVSKLFSCHVSKFISIETLQNIVLLSFNS